MQTNRRDFLRTSLIAGIGIVAGIHPYELDGRARNRKLVILHTNDQHSRIDPFPANDPKFPGAGGFARRAALIKRIRSEEENVILLDAGDIFQGTPYFNLFKGEAEIKLMTLMGYDAATIGNHDFDGGIENLATRIKQAGFPFLNANYDFSDTPVSGLCLPMRVIDKGGFKIGVFGVGIELKGLVSEESYGKTRYSDPLVAAKKMTRLLRREYRCDLVVCLSHLGYKYDNEKVSDVVLAKHVADIDLIIGGHTHTFLDEPVRVMNPAGKNTLIAQAGWGGLRLGRIDFLLGEYNEKTTSYIHEKTFNYTIA
ncbi:MAG: bifunctional metallophosphatase/5'-nucleotidase [Bacteroidota bacterium]